MSDDENIKILKQRYTNGEIDRKTYLQMKEDLTEGKATEKEAQNEAKNRMNIEDSALKRSYHKGRRLAGWSLAVIIIVVAVVFLFQAAYNNNNTEPYSNGGGGGIFATQHTVTMYAQGYVISLSPKESNSAYYSVPSSATSVSLTGSYSSSGGTVEAAVLTAQQYANFTSTAYKTDALAAGYAYYGDTSEESIDTQLVPGNTYYVVFYDPGIFTSVSVDIESSIILQYTTS